jgi:hypothetical protein
VEGVSATHKAAFGRFNDSRASRRQTHHSNE